MLSLLVRVTKPESERVVHLLGEQWELKTLHSTQEQAAQPYTCVSYNWGPGRVPNPIDPEHDISDRAISVLQSAARHCRTSALWFDAFCTPTEASKKKKCLSNLGAIYARATEVLVVLSEDCAPFFHQHEQKRLCDVMMLGLLEQAAWVTRFWTYQELAGSQEVRFLAEGTGKTAIEGLELLNHVGQALDRERKGNPRGKTAFPNVDNLMDVLASWQLAGAKPFAYQILTGMTPRYATHVSDRFNAALGILAPNSAIEGSTDLLEASEIFMNACEALGDFSFIYTNAPRNTKSKHGWRPIAGDLTPIVPWHTFGHGQQGSLKQPHLQLQDMFCAQSGPLEKGALEFVCEWLADCSDDQLSNTSLATRVLKKLRSMGFIGTGDPISLSNGYFFPLNQFVLASDDRIMLATEVCWVHGCPALLVATGTDGRYRYRGVGVFVGPTPRAAGTAIDLVSDSE